MSNPSRRDRNKKCHQTRSTGARTIIQYRQEKTSTLNCSSCDQELAGIQRLDSAKIGNLTGTRKRIGHIYSGYLCHSCLGSLFMPAARKL